MDVRTDPGGAKVQSRDNSQRPQANFFIQIGQRPGFASKRDHAYNGINTELKTDVGNHTSGVSNKQKSGNIDGTTSRGQEPS